MNKIAIEYLVTSLANQGHYEKELPIEKLNEICHDCGWTLSEYQVVAAKPNFKKKYKNLLGVSSYAPTVRSVTDDRPATQCDSTAK